MLAIDVERLGGSTPTYLVKMLWQGSKRQKNVSFSFGQLYRVSRDGINTNLAAEGDAQMGTASAATGMWLL